MDDIFANVDLSKTALLRHAASSVDFIEIKCDKQDKKIQQAEKDIKELRRLIKHATRMAILCRR